MLLLEEGNYRALWGIQHQRSKLVQGSDSQPQGNSDPPPSRGCMGMAGDAFSHHSCVWWGSKHTGGRVWSECPLLPFSILMRLCCGSSSLVIYPTV